jgi:hypothetical protein
MDPVPHYQSRWRLAIVVLTIAGLALALWRLNGPALGSLAAMTSRPTPSQILCPTPKVTRAAATALAAPQLATQLRDATHNDFRPANHATTFAPGQRAYVTFRISTNSRGIAELLLCTAATRFRGSLAVPPDSADRFGQFSAAFATGDLGPGEAVLFWDGQVAAILPFHVTRNGMH